MVEVGLNSKDCDMAINWYIHKYGKSEKKATEDEVRFLNKLQTMRDALFIEEEEFRLMK